MKLSTKNTTVLLILLILAFSYQTYALVDLGQKIRQSQIAFGASTAVNFDSSTPDMVGGC